MAARRKRTVADATDAAWARPPRQARSQATLERLLRAVGELLSEGRFQSATVAEIVRRARSSTGAFYARFRDKQALFHAFEERLFEQGRQTWTAVLDPERHRGATLARVIGVVVGRLVETRRRHAPLLRALLLYARTSNDPVFRARAARANRFVIERLQRLLLAHGERIRHPRPRRAIELGLLTLDAMIRDSVLFEHAGLGPAQLPDAELGRELTRMFLAYLEVGKRQHRKPIEGRHSRQPREARP